MSSTADDVVLGCMLEAIVEVHDKPVNPEILKYTVERICNYMYKFGDPASEQVTTLGALIANFLKAHSLTVASVSPNQFKTLLAQALAIGAHPDVQREVRQRCSTELF